MATHSSVLAWEMPMDRGVWWATAHGVAKSWTRLSNFTTTTSWAQGGDGVDTRGEASGCRPGGDATDPHCPPAPPR